MDTHERTVLAGLVVAVAGVAVWVQASTPASLVAPPERPMRAFGNGSVRTGSLAFPRHAIGADDRDVAVPRVPERIVSQYWSVDEYVYTLVPPQRVVGVSDTAYSDASSNVLPFVTRYRPAIAMDPEQVLRTSPDLVIAPDSGRWEVTGVLRDAGLPVYRMHTQFETLDAIAAHIGLVGYLTGADAAAAAEKDRFFQVIGRAAARRPSGAAAPRVLGMGATYTYGSQTLFHDILRVLGAENVAATHGFTGYDHVSDEQIVRWDPDWIVAGAVRGRARQTRAALLARPAIAATSAARLGHVVAIEDDVFLPMSPYTVRLVERLAAILYGGADGD